MRKAWARWTLFYSCLLISTGLLFQNCGPAKLNSSSDSSSTASIEQAVIGSKVDLNALMQSPQEPASNVLFPSTSAVNEYDYAISAPVIENIVLKTNDFTQILWVHGPTSTVVATGDAFNQSAFTADLLGAYYVIGYRGSTPYMISQIQLVNKGSTTLNVNSVGAVQISQKLISSDSTNETILVMVDAPAVDLSSVQINVNAKSLTFNGRRAALVTKKINEAVDVEFKLSDTTGQNFSKLLNLPAKTLPPPSPTPAPAPAPAPSPAPAPAPSPAPAPAPAPAPKTQILMLDTPNQSIRAGQTLNLILKFNSNPMPEDYKVFVAFVDSSGNEAAFSGSALPNLGTSKWPTGLYSVAISFAIPSNLPYGTYSIRAGFFRNLAPPNNTRIALDTGPGVVADSAFRYAVGNLTVTPASTEIFQLDQPNLAISPGQTLNLNIKFYAVPMSGDYALFIHFVDAAGVQHSDLNGGWYPSTPTSQWSGFFNYTTSIAVPSTVASGKYTIRVGIYKVVEPYLERFPLIPGPGVTADDQTRYTVGTLTIP